MRTILATCFGLTLTLGIASVGGATSALAAPHMAVQAQSASYSASAIAPAESGLLQPVQYRLSPRERARMRERERARERMAQRRRYLSRH